LNDLGRPVGHCDRGAAFGLPPDRSVEGRLAETERGESGFSYDPIFELAGTTKTFAQMPEAQKNAHSHRGLAARALLELLREAVIEGSASPSKPITSSSLPKAHRGPGFDGFRPE